MGVDVDSMRCCHLCQAALFATTGLVSLADPFPTLRGIKGGKGSATRDYTKYVQLVNLSEPEILDSSCILWG